MLDPPPSDVGTPVSPDTFERRASSVVRRSAPFLHVEAIDGRAMVAHQVAWADLVERSIDRNVFLEPAFALPLLQHVAVANRPRFVLVWEENGPATFGRLVGLLPLMPGPALPGHAVLRGFRHNQTALGVPLIDRTRAVETFDALLAWLAAGHPSAAALRLRDLPTDSAFHSLAVARTAAIGAEARGLVRHHRAILRRAEPGDLTRVASFVSTKKRKELKRQRRRLAERGTRTYASARTPAEIARATERFLALEHDGWKGRRGTALLAEPSLATFARTMTRLMAAEGRCRIDTIEIDGRPVAMGILIRSGDRAHFWKTAFDETYGSLSPGLQFAMELTEVQLADADVTATDSCAASDHPMIDRIWPDRLEVEDLVIGLRKDEPRRFERVYRLERLVDRLVNEARALRRRLRRL